MANRNETGHSNVKTRDLSPSTFQKACDLCRKPKDVLIRCQTDESRKWHLVCTGKCWKEVSGGEIDGPSKPNYRYGGMWKNKHALVSAKKPKKTKAKVVDHSNVGAPNEWNSLGFRYTKNDLVTYSSEKWVCRKSHRSTENITPDQGYKFWRGAEEPHHQPETEQELEVA